MVSSQLPIQVTTTTAPTNGLFSSSSKVFTATTTIVAALGANSGPATGFQFIPSSNADIGQWAASGIALIFYAVLLLLILAVVCCVRRKLKSLEKDLNIKPPVSSRASDSKPITPTPYQASSQSSYQEQKPDLPKKETGNRVKKPAALNDPLADFPSFEPKKEENSEDEYSDNRSEYRNGNTRSRAASRLEAYNPSEIQSGEYGNDNRELTAQEEVLVAALSALPAATLQRALTRNRSISSSEPVEPQMNRARTQSRVPTLDRDGDQPYGNRNRAASRAIPINILPEDIASSSDRKETFSMPRGPVDQSQTYRGRTQSRVQEVEQENPYAMRPLPQETLTSIRNRSSSSATQDYENPTSNAAVFGSPKATMARRGRGTAARDTISRQQSGQGF